MTLPILKSNVWNKDNEGELAPWLLNKERGERALAKAKARRHLIDFIELDGYPYWKRAKHLELLCSKLEDVERYVRGDKTGLARLIVTMPPRHGKLCADNTDVLTINGWKKHGELKIGDMVYTPKGKPTKIIAVSSVSYADREVIFKNGTKIKVHHNHEWVVFDRRSSKWRTVETDKLMNVNLSCIEGKNRSKHYIFAVPNISPIEFEEKCLDIDPYFLGVWLGDGKSSDIVICYATRNDAVIKKCISTYGNLGYYSIHKTTGVHYQGFKGIRSLFRKYDLINNKHIPEAYKYSSIKQRLELLAGLIDTDGHVTKTGEVKFSNCNKTLIDDVFEIASSLGFRPFITEQQPKTTPQGIIGRQVVYNVGFMPTMNIPTVLSQKQITRTIYQRLNYIKDIIPCEQEKGKCIQIDSSDGLYLVTKNLIPTHNSHVISKKFPAWFLARNPDVEIILSTYGAELAQDHSEIARDTFREWAPKLWNINLSEKTQAKAKWKVANYRGGMAAVGIGGAATGRGAGLLIIDDPVENAESAMSPTMQEKIWNWWQTVSYTRLSPTGAVVILMTRWAQQDLVGKILEFDKESERPQNWEVLNLPAICEGENDPIGRAIGEVLWPERFSTDWILDKKANTEAFWWQSMWQQKPADITTQVFRPEDMKLIDPTTINLSHCEFYGACDASEGGNDYAVITIVAVLPDKRWLLWNADLSVDNQSTTIEKLVKFSMQYKFKRFWIEQNSLGHAKSAPGKSNFEHRLIEQLQKNNTTLPYLFIWNSENKVNRIRSLEPYYIQGKLLFRSDHHQTYKLLTEQLRFFPFYQHDDGPDALELCIRGIVKESSSVILPKVPKNIIRVGGGWTG